MQQKPITNDELARMVQQGFDHVEQRIDKVEQRMDEQFHEVRLELRSIDKRLSGVVSDRKFDELEERVRDLENMLAVPQKKAA